MVLKQIYIIYQAKLIYIISGPSQVSDIVRCVGSPHPFADRRIESIGIIQHIFSCDECWRTC